MTGWHHTPDRATASSRLGYVDHKILSDNKINEQVENAEGASHMAAPLPSDLAEPTPAHAGTADGLASQPDRSLIVPAGMNATQMDRQADPDRNERHTRLCPFCHSNDTMEPFRRSPRVLILSRILPRLRWQYCRSCTLHFLTFARPKAGRNGRWHGPVSRG
ncbi:MAG TPA: hypothetical protein VMM79_17820 [Longimicrobiales bacterium]|nr:hypothetical protein [Longimicrobiales bacterium]